MVGDPVPHDDQWFKSIEVERRVGPVCRQLIVELLMARFAESEQLHVELRLGIDVHAGEENRSVGQGIPTVSVFQNVFVGGNPLEGLSVRSEEHTSELQSP